MIILYDNKTYACFLCIIVILFIDILCFYCLKEHTALRTPVYCLMITGYYADRTKYAKRSIENFYDQTYKNKHIIIINQSKEKLLEENTSNALEVFIDSKNMTLGELRNMSLEFVPPDAIWTTWDDDDWRDPSYISKMISIMAYQKVDNLLFQNRIEYNIVNNFHFVMTLKSGFMTFFCMKNPSIQYEHVNTSEDVQVKEHILKNLKYFIYNNDPRDYIRLRHNNNTSIYVEKSKNKLKNTINNKNYFERQLSQTETKYLHNIISKYYK